MKLTLFIFCIIFSVNVFSHGENKYGPHLGFVRMPGTFHTELVQMKNGSFNVYLMTMSNSEPVVSHSSVILTHKDINGSSTEYNCKVRNDHFTCNLEKKINLKGGQIIIKANRNGVNGSEAIYNLPLKLALK